MTWDFCFYCFHLPSAWIAGLCHHSQSAFLGIKPRGSCMLGKSLLAELNPQAHKPVSFLTLKSSSFCYSPYELLESTKAPCFLGLSTMSGSESDCLCFSCDCLVRCSHTDETTRVTLILAGEGWTLSYRLYPLMPAPSLMVTSLLLIDNTKSYRSLTQGLDLIQEVLFSPSSL